MAGRRAYRWLCGVLGTAMVVFGTALFASFFRFHMPGSEPGGPLPLGPNGTYFAAFTGCALVAWGGSLWGAARHPETSRAVGTATAAGLVLSAVYRMMAWLVGDYALLGDLPRIEAAVFLLCALAFLWLRPRSHPALAASST